MKYVVDITESGDYITLDDKGVGERVFAIYTRFVRFLALEVVRKWRKKN